MKATPYALFLTIISMNMCGPPPLNYKDPLPHYYTPVQVHQMMKAQEESDRRWEEFKKSIPIVDAAGRTSLHREMLAENPKTYNVGEILKSIPVDATDKDGNTALMLLVQRDDQNYHSSWLDAPEIVRKLLDAGASLTKTNKRNQSALDLATPEAYKILDPNNESLTPTRALKHKIQRWVKQVKEFVNDHLEMFS